MSFRLHDSDVLAVDFEQVIIKVISFTALFANRMLICSFLAAHVSLVLPFLCNDNGMAVVFEQVIVPVLLLLALFVN